MNAIVSVDRNWGIGCRGDLLFHVPEDMKYFKSMTTGKVVVMGEKTFFSLPGQKPLKDRVNIVLSDNRALVIDGAVVMNSLGEVLEAVKKYNADDVFVIGGQAVYELMLDYCDTVYVTRFQAEKPADKFFPDLDQKAEWKLTAVSEPREHDGLVFTFNRYERARR